jgi:hypothetical protein
MLPHIPAAIHPRASTEHTFPENAKLKTTFRLIATPIRRIGTHD